MSEQKHTKEPWREAMGHIASDAGGFLVYIASVRPTQWDAEESAANLARIIACVNALAGLSDDALAGG